MSLDKLLEDYFFPEDVGRNDSNDEHIQAAKKAILKDLLDMLDIVEPCEPDCDEVRHARHQGQWEMHLKQVERVRKYCD